MNSVFPGTYFPPPINLALHGHTHDYQAINFAPGALPDGGTFQPAATLVSGNAGDILDTALPYPLTGSAVSSVGNPTAVSVATVGGVQQFATSDNGTPFQNPNSSTDNDFGYMVLQFNAGPPRHLDGDGIPDRTTPCVMFAPFRRAARCPARLGASSSRTTPACTDRRMTRGAASETQTPTLACLGWRREQAVAVLRDGRRLRRFVRWCSRVPQACAGTGSGSTSSATARQPASAACGPARGGVASSSTRFLRTPCPR